MRAENDYGSSACGLTESIVATLARVKCEKSSNIITLNNLSYLNCVQIEVRFVLNEPVSD